MTGTEWSLECDRCGSRYDFGPMTRGCPTCAAHGAIGVLEATFRPVRPPVPLPDRRGPHGLSRYRDLLPGGQAPDWISLGEGGTPLIRSRRIGPALGLAHLYFKNETVNPTWSFKDRYVCVSLNVARALGRRRVAVSSTGNLGVSVAAYAAAMGMACAFIVSEAAPQAIIDEARRFGAHILVAPPDRRLPVFEEVVRDGAWFPIGLFLRRPIQNPFGVEGYKTYAYELIEQLGASPAAVLFPCARGNGLYGAFKGFEEARRFGWCATMPALVACQPIGANSIEVSLARGCAKAVELPPIATIAASATEVVAADQALRAVGESGGLALSAREDEILTAVHALSAEGLAVEPSSALPVACLERYVEHAKPRPDAVIVCVLTASGLRWPVAPHASVPPIRRVSGDEAATLLLDGGDGAGQ